MISLHIAILLFGAAALVAQTTSLSPLALTLGRCLVAAPLLLALARVRAPASATWPGMRHLLGAGALLALHWTAFFQAMRLGGVPLALLSYAAFPAFSLLLERWILPASDRPPGRARTRLLQMLLLAVGLVLLALPGKEKGPQDIEALAWGLGAGASFALLAHWNAHLRRHHGALMLTGGQLAGAALLLLPWTLPALAAATPADWICLLVLGLGCTALGHGLFQHALGKVPPFQAGIAAGLEPLYGLGLAALMGHQASPAQWLALPFMLGAALLGLRKSGDLAANGSNHEN